jgi:hypothetical protein
MVRRFPIPPPLVTPDPARETIDADLDKDMPEEVLSVLERTGVLSLYNQVCQNWLPYAMKRLEMVVVPDAVGPLTTVEGQHQSALAWGQSVCTAMALFYVGRRLGTFHLKLHETNSDGSDERETDGTVRMTSSALDELSKLVGERTAAEIFRKLETVTSRVLKQVSGKSAQR